MGGVEDVLGIGGGQGVVEMECEGGGNRDEGTKRGSRVG